MQVFFKKRSSGQIEFGVIYGGIALLVLCAARLLPILSIAPACAFKGLTGIPCPTCGSTRALLCLSQGKLAAALAMNPLTALVFMAAILYLLYSVVTLAGDLPRVNFLFTDREKNMVRTALVILLFAQWFYLIRSL
jgi:Protein of unknown function (DUF2752)